MGDGDLVLGEKDRADARARHGLAGGARRRFEELSSAFRPGASPRENWTSVRKGQKEAVTWGLCQETAGNRSRMANAGMAELETQSTDCRNAQSAHDSATTFDFNVLPHKK
jgi:hypothetical protein